MFQANKFGGGKVKSERGITFWQVYDLDNSEGQRSRFMPNQAAYYWNSQSLSRSDAILCQRPPGLQRFIAIDCHYHCAALHSDDLTTLLVMCESLMASDISV